MSPKWTARFGTPEARATFVFFALLFVVFTAVFPYNTGLHNPNETVRAYTTIAIVEDHTFAIDDVVRRLGWVEDMAALNDSSGVTRHYSVKGPGVAYAGVPVYWVFARIASLLGHVAPTVESSPAYKAWWLQRTTLVLRIFVVQLPCFAFLVWFERWLRATTAGGGKSDIVLRLTTVAAVAVGTNYLAYSLMFVSHTLFGVTAFTSFAIVTREQLLFRDPHRRRTSMAFLAGVFSTLGSLLEYQAFPISLGLTLYALPTFRQPRRLAAFLGGAAINAAALMFYQWRCFGSPFTPGHTMAESPTFSQWHSRGFFGIVLRADRLGEFAKAFDALSFGHAFGFFGTSPFMVLGLLAVPAVWWLRHGARRTQRIRLIANAAWLAMMLVLWVLISAALNWRGGWTVGPRFFGCAPPFFGFGALCALEAIAKGGATWRIAARTTACGLALASTLEIGFVSLHFNSVPEDVTRPLAQLSLPLARAGFVPHHVGELLGLTSPTGWYVVCGCMFAAALLPALLLSGDRGRAYVARVALVPLVFLAAVRGAFSDPGHDEGGDGGADARSRFAHAWEPRGRDGIAALRAQAEREGADRPCAWHELAALERSVSWDVEADRDAALAGVPASQCK